MVVNTTRTIGLYIQFPFVEETVSTDLCPIL
jgi:hypothetical protein